MNSIRIAAGLLVVVVVYERDLDQVVAWPILRQWLGDESPAGLAATKHVLIYDNSAVPRARPRYTLTNCSYVHDAENGGTARAYRCALSAAKALQVDWLLLLDHDTTLPAEFLPAVTAAVASAGESPTIRAFVPWVMHGKRLPVSPSIVTRFGSIRPVRRELCVKPDMQITAIASGAVINAAAFEEIMPFPAGLWLDYVDHWMFAQFHKRGYHVKIMNVAVDHDLSIAGPMRLTPARLVSLLRGEARYYETLGSWARLVYPLRVGWRLTRMTATNPRLGLVAWSWMLGRASSDHDR